MRTDIAANISGVILAGGQGRRMGYVNKGLQPLDGKALVQWVIERLAPQVDSLFINANRDAADYGAFGYPVIADLIPDFAGPLAGIHRALQHVQHPLLATAPCDAPYLPADLVARLHQALQQRRAAQIAVARSGGQIHPVFSLIRTEALPSLTRFLADGGRAIKHWHATLDSCVVDFDDASAFGNINTPTELQTISLSTPTIAV